MQILMMKTVGSVLPIYPLMKRKTKYLVLGLFLGTYLFLCGFSGESGKALFEKRDYAGALKALKSEVHAHPKHAELNYYLGRSYLALNQPEEALPYLQKAAGINSKIADYHFWLGVNYWALLEFEKELHSYKTALAIDPDHIPSRVYAGHNHMDRGQWEKALAFYENVLTKIPDNAEALFNAGRAYRELGQTRKENDTWKTFLSFYRNGQKAFTAVNFLNANGDFSYRTFRFGRRLRVLKQIEFIDGRATLLDESIETIETAGRAINQNQDFVLQVLVYVNQDKPLAEKRAKNIKRAFLKTIPALPADRIKISWFGVPERLNLDKKQYDLSPSVRFFTTPAGE